MNKTVSLKTSKQLKEAGFSQDTDFSWWWNFPEAKVHFLKSTHHTSSCAAPTAEEILDEINGTVLIKKVNKEYVCTNDPAEGNDFFDQSLAEEAALLWLYLKAQGLLKGTE